VAGLFLTTAALHILLTAPASRMGQAIARAPLAERWVSPLSHAILTDSYFSQTMTPAARRAGLRAVEQHRRGMRQFPVQYPFPDEEAVRIWSEIRSVAIDIPAYDDGIGRFPAQAVGPDELLVFATAAALAKPLIGPAPVDAEVIGFLTEHGIRFSTP
jgi:hypothetical protein